MTTRDEHKAIILNALSTRVYTPARDFNPRIKGRVPDKEVFALLKEMQEQGQAELAYGRGWRAVEQEPAPNADEAALYRTWQDKVALGLTVLGYQDWVTNTAIANGWTGE